MVLLSVIVLVVVGWLILLLLKALGWLVVTWIHFLVILGVAILLDVLIVRRLWRRR
jgi:hypothetical protein